MFLPAGQLHGFLPHFSHQSVENIPISSILRLVRHGGSRDDPLRPGAAGVQLTVRCEKIGRPLASPFSYHGITITYL